MPFLYIYCLGYFHGFAEFLVEVGETPLNPEVGATAFRTFVDVLLSFPLGLLLLNWLLSHQAYAHNFIFLYYNIQFRLELRIKPILFTRLGVGEIRTRLYVDWLIDTPCLLAVVRYLCWKSSMARFINAD